MTLSDYIKSLVVETAPAAILMIFLFYKTIFSKMHFHAKEINNKLKYD